MRTRLRRKFKLLFVALGLLLALPAAVWADATLDTSADLSTSVATPTNVGIGDNTFKIKVWAFQGNVPSGKNGEVNVGTKYNMSTTGTITPDTTSTQKVDFSNINYSQCPSSGTIPQGCPGNPFEVTATLNVASGTPNGKTGTLTVYHAPLTDSGLIADSVPATGQVKVLIPDSTPPVITPNVSGTLGSNGWYKSDVSLTWSVTDPESTVTKIGCVDQNITADQAATDYSCSATSAGGSAGPVTVSIKRDATPPTAIQFEGGPDAGGSYPFGSVPAAPTCDANFAISGKADCVVTDYSTAVSAPGTHMMTATATDLAGNQATATRSYTVTKADQAALTVDSPNSGTYGQKLTMTASGGSTDGAITFSVVPGSSACAIVASGPDQGKLEITDGMGTCKITATRAGNANYNDVTSAQHTVAVNKRAVTVTADAKSKVYGEDDPELTYQITSGSLVNNDSFDGALSRAPGNNVGTYAIQQGTLSLSSNYNLTYVGTNLTINKRPITVTADAKSKLFGDPDPAPLTYQVTSQLNPALVGTDQLTGSLTRVAGEAVGTYTIQQGTLTAGSNYTITYVGANLTIGAWTPSGFYSPVGLPNSYYQAPGGPLPPAPTSANDATLNTAKGGSTVPLKFNIFAGSVEKTSTSDVKGFSATKLSGCASGADVDEIDFITTGSTSLRYDTTAKQFIQNWQTPKVNSDTCYRTTVTFQDGTSIHAFFRLRK